MMPYEELISCSMILTCGQLGALAVLIPVYFHPRRCDKFLPLGIRSSERPQ